MEPSSFQGQEKDLNTRPITPILETQEATRSSLQPTKASKQDKRVSTMDRDRSQDDAGFYA